MIEKVKETIEKYRLLEKGDRVIIALYNGLTSRETISITLLKFNSKGSLSLVKS